MELLGIILIGLYVFGTPLILVFAARSYARRGLRWNALTDLVVCAAFVVSVTKLETPWWVVTILVGVVAVTLWYTVRAFQRHAALLAT